MFSTESEFWGISAVRNEHAICICRIRNRFTSIHQIYIVYIQVFLMLYASTKLHLLYMYDKKLAYTRKRELSTRKNLLILILKKNI